MANPPNQNPDLRRQSALPDTTGKVVVSELKLKEALNEALGQVTVESRQKSDDLFDQEELTLDRSKAVRLEIENENLRQNIELRKTFGNRAYVLAVGWLSSVFFLVLCSGIAVNAPIAIKGLVPSIELEFSDTVLVTLLTTTTITVVGLITAVTVNLFPKKRDDAD